MSRLQITGIVTVIVLAAIGMGIGVGMSGTGGEVPPMFDPEPVADSEQLNVVFVIGCTMRKDQITPYGAPENVTPFLQRHFADRGVVFDDAIAASSWTKAGVTALLTGRHALTVGMTEPGPRQNRRSLDPRVPTLAQRLNDAGYETIGVTANPNLNRAFGLAQGFDAYHDSADEGFSKKEKIYGDQVVAKALSMLEKRDSAKPAFLQLTFIDPHFPFTPKPGSVDAFRQEGLPDNIAKYRSMVRQVDDAVASLHDSLEQYGITDDNTLWVMVNDHGEGLNFPAHHRGQHGRVLYPSVSEAIWMVSGPGVAHAQVEGMAAQTDVLPTLLEFLDLESPAEVTGRSHAAALRDGSATERKLAYSDTWYYGANRAAVWRDDVQCQLDWGSVGIKNDTFREGCFDREADPTFLMPFEEAELIKQLRAWRETALAASAAFGAGEDAAVEDGVGDQLEALGYVE